MAQLDPSIILQAGKGVVPLKDPSEIADEQAVRQMRQLQVQQAQQGVQDDQAYRDVLRSGATGRDLVSNLQQRGLGKQAMDAQKFQTEQQKATHEAGKVVAEGMKSGAAMILANPTEENAIQTLTMAQQQYGLPAQMVDGAKAQIYAARNDPNKLKQLAVGWGGDAEKVLGKFQSVNLGGVNQVQSINPATGELTVGATQARTQSPDSLASQGVTMRGQDMADARAQQANAIRAAGNALGKFPAGYEPDPNKPGALRPIQGGPADPNTPKGKSSLTEGQSKALLFGSRMQEANEIFDSLEKDGKVFSTPGANTGYGVGAAVNLVNSSDGQRLDQAKRNFINATLRKESGAAIAESEFANANQQYFPQAGDSKEVIAQKRQNRATAMRGMLEEVPDSDARVARVRGGTSAEPAGEPAKKQPIQLGMRRNGFIYKGGNPNDRASWEPEK